MPSDLLDFITLALVAVTIGAPVGLVIAWRASLFAQAERDLVNPDLDFNGDVSWD